MLGTDREMPPQRAGPKHLVPDQRPGLRPKPRLNHLLQKMLTGFATRRQMIAAVVEAALAAKAARKAGKAVGVARVLGKGAGKGVLWNGGLSLQIGLQLVEVIVAGTGPMMIQVGGSPYATRNGWLKLLLRRMLLPLGLFEFAD